MASTFTIAATTTVTVSVFFTMMMVIASNIRHSFQFSDEIIFYRTFCIASNAGQYLMSQNKTMKENLQAKEKELDLWIDIDALGLKVEIVKPIL